MTFGYTHAQIHQLAAYQKFGDRWFHYKWQVRHLDGNRFNNKLENLELGTNTDNQQDRPIEDRRKSTSIAFNTPLRAQKSAEGVARLLRSCSDEQVRQIRNDYSTGMIKADIARKYNICRHIVRNIINEKSYKSVK